jgi:hypothetical protein
LDAPLNGSGPILQTTAVMDMSTGHVTSTGDSTAISPSSQTDQQNGSQALANSKMKRRLEFGFKQQQDRLLKHLFDLARSIGIPLTKAFFTDGPSILVTRPTINF